MCRRGRRPACRWPRRPRREAAPFAPSCLRTRRTGSCFVPGRFTVVVGCRLEEDTWNKPPNAERHAACRRLALPRRRRPARVRAILLLGRRDIGLQDRGQGEGTCAVYVSGLLAYAESRLGATVRWLLAMARAYDSVVVGTVLESRHGGVYNTMCGDMTRPLGVPTVRDGLAGAWENPTREGVGDSLRGGPLSSTEGVARSAIRPDRCARRWKVPTPPGRSASGTASGNVPLAAIKRKRRGPYTGKSRTGC